MKAKVLIDPLVTHVVPEERITSTTLKDGLVKEIKSLCEKLDKDGTSPDELLIEAVAVAKKYKMFGSPRQEAYDMIELIYRHCPDGSSQEEFIGDILDCICGNVGNKEYQVY